MFAALMPILTKFLTAKAIAQGIGGGSQAPAAEPGMRVAPPALTGVAPAPTMAPSPISTGRHDGLLKALGLSQ